MWTLAPEETFEVELECSIAKAVAAERIARREVVGHEAHPRSPVEKLECFVLLAVGGEDGGPPAPLQLPSRSGKAAMAGGIDERGVVSQGQPAVRECAHAEVVLF